MAEIEGFEPPQDVNPLLVFKTSPFSQTWVNLRNKYIGGAKRDRTADPLRARQVLSQLSYGPNFYKWSGRQDLNLRPPGPKPGALPSCATSRKNGALGRNRTHNLLIRSQALYPVELLAQFINGALGRNRTGTEFEVRRILSPVRLPVSPPGHTYGGSNRT